MTAPVEDLAAWLTAVWDEEERLATEAAELANGPEWDALEYDYEGIGISSFPLDATHSSHRTAETRHIAYHDPASVLARIAADRSILARYQRACERADDPSEDEAARYEWGVIASTYEEVLCELATALQDRPDFRPEWLVERQGVEQ